MDQHRRRHGLAVHGRVGLWLGLCIGGRARGCGGLLLPAASSARAASRLLLLRLFVHSRLFRRRGLRLLDGRLLLDRLGLDDGGDWLRFGLLGRHPRAPSARGLLGEHLRRDRRLHLALRACDQFRVRDSVQHPRDASLDPLSNQAGGSSDGDRELAVLRHAGRSVVQADLNELQLAFLPLLERGSRAEACRPTRARAPRSAPPARHPARR